MFFDYSFNSIKIIGDTSIHKADDWFRVFCRYSEGKHV